MRNELLEEIIQKIDRLTTEEQLSLIDAIISKTKGAAAGGRESSRTWSDLKGLLSHPAYGEDAQSYITRSRRESDEKRVTDTVR